MAKITDLPQELLEMIMVHFLEISPIFHGGLVGFPALRVSRSFRDTFASVFKNSTSWPTHVFSTVKREDATDLEYVLDFEESIRQQPIFRKP